MILGVVLDLGEERIRYLADGKWCDRCGFVASRLLVILSSEDIGSILLSLWDRTTEVYRGSYSGYLLRHQDSHKA